ncbi:MAG: long-chain fatty acid--CoA ligase [Gammaproteobacteria bacterium]
MTDWQEDLILAETAVTLDGLFRERVRRSPDKTAYLYYEQADKAWRELKWRSLNATVNQWRSAFVGEQLESGARVAISLKNSVEWVCFDQAVLGEGLVSVPLYTEDRPDNVAYIIDDAAVSVLLLASVKQWQKLVPSLAEDNTLQRVLILSAKAEEIAALDDERIMKVDDWLNQAEAEPTEREADAQALASIVYTSGTTGRPKGVMLSHWNMLSVAHAAAASVDCYQQDLFLSFLPLSHTLERTGGYYLPMMAASSVAFSRSVAQLADDLATVKPTIMIAVPRIFEKIHGRIMQQLEKGSFLPRALFNATVSTGWRRFERQQGRTGWRPGLLLYPFLNRLVARKITQKLGGRLRYAVSGGAALPLPVAKTFISLGVNILQGYGLTETSPVLSVNRPVNNDPASVGEPLRGIEAKVVENDELVVKSPGIMLGYWNNHAATADMIDPEGWLHTGDQARIEGGRIYITGRIKDILVLSNGEKVPPCDMEAAISLSTLIEQALVVGEGRAYLTALVVLDSVGWVEFANTIGVNPFDKKSLSNSTTQKKVLAVIQQQLHDFPGYAKIRRVNLSLDPWTIEDGLMTPTQKIKRKFVLERFSEQIEAMYTG